MPLLQQVIPGLRLTSGSGATPRLGAECDRLGVSRVALFCSGSLIRDPALHGAVRDALGARLVGTFADVLPHSPLPSVEAAAQALGRTKADCVLAVGGGSVIVTARAASILSAEGLPAAEICSRMDASGNLVSPRLGAPKLAHIVMPTTPTTAIVKAGAAIHDPRTGERLALFDPKTRARSVLLAPELMTPVPSPVFLSAGFNALAMAIEGLTSPLPSSALADAQLIHAIRLISATLRAAVVSRDAESRLQLVSAAVLVGQGTDYAGGGVVSALGHAIGPRHHADNGIVNAIMLPAALRFNARHSPAGTAKVAQGFGLGAAADCEAVIREIEALSGDLSLPRCLRDLGVAASDLETIAEASMRDWFLKGNARPITGPEELVALMMQAL